MENSSLDSLIRGLEETRDKTMRHYALPEEVHFLTYGEGKWCIREILHHLADAETVLYERLRRPMAEPAPVMWGFAQDAWCVSLDYRSRSLEVSAKVYHTIREAIVDLARRYYVTHGALTFNHSRMGLRTLKEEYEKVVWHNANHLDQIEKALREGGIDPATLK